MGSPQANRPDRPKPPGGEILAKAGHLDGFSDGAAAAVDQATERRLDEIELDGEAQAAGFPKMGHSAVIAGMRYLHASRTIHQLVTDRNRAVGIYLAVASLLWTASSALLNAKPAVTLFVPIETIQLWCMPVTFATLTVLALFTAFLLIRTRIGLIYEVAKMNVLLGLPVGRVKRIGILSIFFIMHAMISLAGGGTGFLFTYFLLHRAHGPGIFSLLWALTIGTAITVLLIVLYIGTVLYTTADKKLSDGSK
jgi:hypothetical protein